MGVGEGLGPGLESYTSTEKTGTIVTFLATPCFRPPTVEATWVPCPWHPVPSAGRMPLTAWHELHSVCSRACEEGKMKGGDGGGGVIGDRVVGVCWGAWYCSWWAGGVRWAYMWAATGAPSPCAR